MRRDTTGHSLTFNVPVNYAPGLPTSSYTIVADVSLVPFLPETTISTTGSRAQLRR